ncbi:MAG TPA: AMP-binding protein, partial [Bacillota bacterium]|nr:AMP-binding protein [Bacillota bacterium]
MTNTNSIYKYPLIEVRQINDLRDMVRQSKILYADKVAYLVKDPVAAGKVSPQDADIKQKRKDEQDFLPIKFARAAADFEAFGSWLYESFPQGARVAVVGETRYEWYVTYLATVNGNGIIIPLDKELPSAELQTMLERAHADVLVYSDILCPKL